MQSLQWQIINFWQQKQKLPQSLAELSNPISNYSLPVDPESQKDGRIYEYSVLGDKKFQLCATFDKPMPKGWVDNGSMPYGGGAILPAKGIAVPTTALPVGGVGDSWDHQTGRTCFDRTIDPDLYPPYPKPAK